MQRNSGLPPMSPVANVTVVVVRNWLFGWYIVEFEKGSTERAELYG